MKLSLAHGMRGPRHAIAIDELGATTLPESLLHVFQHVLAGVAVQAERFLLTLLATAAYPAVYMSCLRASLQYADVLDVLLAEAP